MVRWADGAGPADLLTAGGHYTRQSPAAVLVRMLVRRSAGGQRLLAALLLLLLAGWPLGVAAGCPASCSCQQDVVSCSDKDLTANMTTLDLSNNNFQRIPSDLYKTFPSLRSLDLSHNQISKVPANAFKKLPLESLSLAWNQLEALVPGALNGLTRLTELDLSSNRLSELPEQSFADLRQLRELQLDRNSFSRVPSKALASTASLKALGLGGNQLTNLPENAFNTLDDLLVLSLKNNYIQDVDDEAFAGLGQLDVLELEGNLLADIPKAIGRLTAVQSIQLSGNRLTYVREGVLQRAPSLEKLELGGNPILTVDRDAFSNLPRLKQLKLSGVKELVVFPNLNGTSQLLDLRIYGSRLTAVPDDLCSVAPGLRRIYLPSNNLKSLPRLDQCVDLRLLDVSYNAIASISGQLFKHQSMMHDLLLRDNQIDELPADTFVGLTQLLILDLRANKIASIAEDTFVPLVHLQRLNLNDNRFPRLPHRGLERVMHLHCSNMLELREFPEPSQLPQLHSVEVSYAYHCCQFRDRHVPRNETLEQIQETVIFASADQLEQLGDELVWSEVSLDNLTLDDYIDSDDVSLFEPKTDAPDAFIKCSPAPSPFMPCEDLFDWWTLRCGVWVVFLLALLGNGTVVFVLVFARSKMDVPRFLVCNLAAADFFMGVYLGFLAVVDASTLGEFRKYAIAWQMSAGCKLAGFLGVLSSELSVFTLAVITMERNYAITHAMHLNKRLSIKHASYIMACGWLFALVMATLPLVGVSDYRRFAVCLPFQTAGAGTGYVVLLMFFNGLAFTILMGCYWKMYCAIRGSQAWNSNDSRIAKRMALLVFTDFLCWAPIAFFAVTAAFGVRLIGLSGAKVFTVFILPFNSCCNPFLYAIMTKQFKKDCVMICKAIEESRVTRGIGRCRHSSNFSNRHTPANTNSLADRASKESKDSAQCSCSQRLLHEPIKPPAPSRWDTFRALWCPTQPKDALDSSNDYAYQIAEIQKNQEKNKRNASLSSDNFSSSRSDSLRARNGMNRFVPNRRRNSWTVTRKPSQDSNLSSSRNDSSATAGSNTTQSWRLSRSSVSSDMSSSALLRGQGSLHKASLTEAAERAGSLRGHPLRQNSGIVLSHPAGHQHGLHHGHPHGLHHGHHHGHPHAHALPHPLLKQASGGILKPKPKLTRQIAFSDEAAAAAAAAVGGGAQTPGRHHESSCPLHCAEPPPRRQSRFHNIYSKLTESSQEESSGVDDGVALDDSEGGAVGGAVGGPLAGAVGGTPAQIKMEGRNGGLTVAFVPRKLSTISSQSYSLQRESHNNVSQVSPEKEREVPSGVPSLPSPLLGGPSVATLPAPTVEKAHSAGDVRSLAARPRASSSDTCISRQAQARAPPPAQPAGQPAERGIENRLAGDEGFDDIDDMDEDDAIVITGAAGGSTTEQATPLLWREARSASPATVRDSRSPSLRSVCDV